MSRLRAFFRRLMTALRQSDADGDLQAEIAAHLDEAVAPPMRAMHGSGVPVYGRLRPGLPIDAAARELTARPATREGKPQLRVSLTTLYEDTTEGYGRTIVVLSGRSPSFS